MADAARSLSYSIEVTANTSQAEQNIRNLSSELGTLTSATITPHVDTSQAEQNVRNLSGELGLLQSSEIGVDANTSQAEQNVRNLNGELGALQSTDVHVNANTSDAEHNIRNVNSELGSLHGADVQVNANTSEAEANVRNLANEINSLQDKTVNINVNTNGESTGSKSGGILSGFASGGIAGAAFEGIKAGAGMAAGAVKNFVGESVKIGAKFDTAMSQVAATMGKTVSEMNQEVVSCSVNGKEFVGNLNDFAQHMGATTAFSAIQSAEALNFMALAGYDAETSMKTLPTVLNLAAAGNMDLASASDLVTDALSAFGLGADDAGHFADIMAKTSSVTNTSVDQLGRAYLQIGALAQEVGDEVGDIDLTQISAMMGAMANVGIKGAKLLATEGDNL